MSNKFGISSTRLPHLHSPAAQAAAQTNLETALKISRVLIVHRKVPQKVPQVPAGPLAEAEYQHPHKRSQARMNKP